MGIGDSWGTREELLHPRDSHGRFRSKWKMAAGTVEKILGFLGSFNPKTFPSDQEAAKYAAGHGGKYGSKQGFVGGFMRNASRIQSDMRAGKNPPEAAAVSKAMRPAPDDLILSRVVGPEAFGLTPQNLDQIEEYTGKLVADKGFSFTNLGTPMQAPPGSITMTLATPKGTPVLFPWSGPKSGSREVVMDADTSIRITKVDKDGRGGYYVLGVVEPGNPKTAKHLGTRAPRRTEADQNDVVPRGEGATPAQPDQAGAPAAAPAQPQEPTGAGPAPRSEPIHSESVGGDAPAGQTPAPAAPQAPGETPSPDQAPVPGQAPTVEAPAIVNFREAVREADIPIPAAGKARLEWNNAYLGFATGKRPPEDVMRELRSDITHRQADIDDRLSREESLGLHDQSDLEALEALRDLAEEKYPHLKAPKQKETKAPAAKKAPAKKAAEPKAPAPRDIGSAPSAKERTSAADTPERDQSAFVRGISGLRKAKEFRDQDLRPSPPPKEEPKPKRSGPDLKLVKGEGGAPEQAPSKRAQGAGANRPGPSEEDRAKRAERRRAEGSEAARAARPVHPVPTVPDSELGKDAKTDMGKATLGLTESQLADKKISKKAAAKRLRDFADSPVSGADADLARKVADQIDPPKVAKAPAAKKAVPKAPAGESDDEILARARKLSGPPANDEDRKLLADAARISEARSKDLAQRRASGTSDAKESPAKNFPSLPAADGASRSYPRDIAVGAEIQADKKSPFRRVARIERPAKGETVSPVVRFFDDDGNLILAASPNEKVSHRGAPSVPAAKKAAPKAPEGTPDLDKATIAQMRDIAGNEGIEVPKKLRLKADIRAHIEAERKKKGSGTSAGEAPKAPERPQGSAPDVDSATIPQLRQIAKDEGITIPSSARRKADIQQHIKDSRAGKTPTPAAKKAATPRVSAEERAAGAAIQALIQNIQDPDMVHEILGDLDEDQLRHIGKDGGLTDLEGLDKGQLRRRITDELGGKRRRPEPKKAPAAPVPDTFRRPEPTPEVPAPKKATKTLPIQDKRLADMIENSSSEELREVAREAGVDVPEGASKEDTVTAIARKLAEQELKNRKTRHDRAERRVTEALAPVAPSADLDELVRDLDATRLPADVMGRVREDLENPKITPAQAGRNLERSAKFRRDHAAIRYNSGGNDSSEFRQEQKAKQDREYQVADEMQKLADRLKTTRRKPAKKAAPAKAAPTPAPTPAPAPPTPAPAPVGRHSTKPAIPNGWGGGSGEIHYHPDGTIGTFLDRLPERAIEVRGDRLDNVLGKLATDAVMGRKTQEELLDELRKVAKELPEGRARDVVLDMVKGMEAPATKAPELPHRVPSPVSQLMEDLHRVPYVRGNEASRGRTWNEMTQLQNIMQQWEDGKISPLSLIREVRNLGNHIHESHEGKFEVDRAVRKAEQGLESMFRENRESLRPPHLKSDKKPEPPKDLTPRQQALRHGKDLLDKGMDEPEHRKRVAPAVEVQAELTPHVMQELRGISMPYRWSPEGLAYTREYDSANAYYTWLSEDPEDRPEFHIHIHPGYGDSDEVHFSMEPYESGFATPTGFKDPMAAALSHEYGHHVSRQFMTREGGMSPAVASELFPLMNAVLGSDALFPLPSEVDETFTLDQFNLWTVSNYSAISSRVSEYGSRSVLEFLAEVWQEYSSRGPKARPAIRALGERMQLIAEGRARDKH